MSIFFPPRNKTENCIRKITILDRLMDLNTPESHDTSFFSTFETFKVFPPKSFFNVQIKTMRQKYLITYTKVEKKSSACDLK